MPANLVYLWDELILRKKLIDVILFVVFLYFVRMAFVGAIWQLSPRLRGHHWIQMRMKDATENLRAYGCHNMFYVSEIDPLRRELAIMRVSSAMTLIGLSAAFLLALVLIARLISQAG